MAYTPDPRVLTAPTDSEEASTAAAEFRALKTCLSQSLMQSVLEFDAAADRTTDDSAAFNDWITAALTVTAVNPDGRGISLDLQGRCFALSAPWTPSGISGLTLKNGGLFAVGTWSNANYLVAPGSGMNGFTLENMYIDCNSKCRAFNHSSNRQILRDCFVVRFAGAIAVNFAGAGTDSGIEGGYYQQWMSSDSEFSTGSNFTASCVYLNGLRHFVRNATFRYSKANVKIGSDSQFASVRGCRIYNTNPAMFGDPTCRLFQQDSGAQGTVVTGNYFADGTIRVTGTFDIQFDGNAVKADNTGSTQSEFMTVEGTGADIGKKFRSENWFIQSDQILNGTIPFYNFTGTFSTFDPSKIENANALEVTGPKVIANCAPSGTPFREYVSGTSEMKVVYRNKDTLTSAEPSINMDGSFLYFVRLKKPVSSLSASRDSTGDDCGKILRAALGGALTYTLTNNLPEGWHTTVHHISGAFTLTLATEAGASWSHISAVVDPITSKGVGSHIDVRCVQNTDGSSAVFAFIGDAQ